MEQQLRSDLSRGRSWKGPLQGLSQLSELPVLLCIQSSAALLVSDTSNILLGKKTTFENLQNSETSLWNIKKLLMHYLWCW